MCGAIPFRILSSLLPPATDAAHRCRFLCFRSLGGFDFATVFIGFSLRLGGLLGLFLGFLARLFRLLGVGQGGGIGLHPERILERDELLFDACLLGFQRVRRGAIGLERLVHEVLRLDDFAVEHALAEVIVDGKEGGVVEVRRHDIRVRDVGPDVLIREPEHGAGGESEIAVDCQQRADGEDLHVEERVVLVEIPRLFDVIRADLLGGDVALVDDKRRLFAPLM